MNLRTDLSCPSLRGLVSGFSKILRQLYNSMRESFLYFLCAISHPLGRKRNGYGIRGVLIDARSGRVTFADDDLSGLFGEKEVLPLRRAARSKSFAPFRVDGLQRPDLPGIISERDQDMISGRPDPAYWQDVLPH